MKAEIFEHCKIIYKEVKGGQCDKCVFYISEENECTNRTGRKCSHWLREDDNNIHFIKIGEVQD